MEVEIDQVGMAECWQVAQAGFRLDLDDAGVVRSEEISPEETYQKFLGCLWETQGSERIWQGG